MKKILLPMLLLVICHCALSGVIHVPYDCPAPCEAIRVPELPTSHPIPVPWVAAATVNPGIAGDGFVEVDWMQLIEYGDEPIEVLSNYFDQDGMLSPELGGLFDRWFPAGGTRTPLTNSQVKDGILRVNVGHQPDKVNHWWLAGYQGTPGLRYALKIRFRVHGNIGVQLGCDYWTVPSEDGSATLIEGWCSDWYGDTGGEFIEVISPMPEEEQVKFRRMHYGFIKEGIFFVSRELMDYIGCTEAFLLHGGKGYPMTLRGDKYVADTDRWFSFKTGYRFRVSNPMQTRMLPDAIYDPEQGVNHLFHPGDVHVDNIGGYYYFYTRWQDATFCEEINPADCNVWLDASSICHIKAIRPKARIKQVDFYDIRGRKLFSHSVQAAEGLTSLTIPMPKLAAQALLVKVTETGGQSVVKKLAVLPK